MRFGNPAVRRMVRQSDGGALYSEGQEATYKGVYLKAALYAALTIITAVGCELGLFKAISDGYIAQALTVIGIAAGVSLIPLLIIAFVIAFVPSTAKVLGCIYAILQGGLLGLLSLCWFFRESPLRRF